MLVDAAKGNEPPQQLLDFLTYLERAQKAVTFHADGRALYLGPQRLRAGNPKLKFQGQLSR